MKRITQFLNNAPLCLLIGSVCFLIANLASLNLFGSLGSAVLVASLSHVIYANYKARKAIGEFNRQMDRELARAEIEIDNSIDRYREEHAEELAKVEKEIIEEARRGR